MSCGRNVLRLAALAHLLGSEGTLGIVTEATLKVRNIPEYITIARVSFDSVKQAAGAVIKILQRGIQV